MALAENSGRINVRLNSADWEILEVMSDGRRYTQQHLYDDIPELDDHSPDWIRQRISHLHDIGFVQKVGTSAMYEISDVGIAALILREQFEEMPTGQELAQMVYSKAETVDRQSWFNEDSS